MIFPLRQGEQLVSHPAGSPLEQKKSDRFSGLWTERLFQNNFAFCLKKGFGF